MKSKNKRQALKNSIEEHDDLYVMNGKDKVSLEELIAKYKEGSHKESKSGQEEEAKILNADDEVEVEGKLVPVKELLHAYNNLDPIVENEDKEEREEHYRDAEKDDAAHIDYLERDMKDDARARKKLENEDRHEEEERYRDAEKDDAAHIDYLERDMKDDARKRKKLENSDQDRKEREDHYRGAEKDDAAHIRDLEDDMKDDARKRKELRNRSCDSDFDTIKNAKKKFLETGADINVGSANFFEEERARKAKISEIYGSSSNTK